MDTLNTLESIISKSIIIGFLGTCISYITVRIFSFINTRAMTFLRRLDDPDGKKYFIKCVLVLTIIFAVCWFVIELILHPDFPPFVFDHMAMLMVW